MILCENENGRSTHGRIAETYTNVKIICLEQDEYYEKILSRIDINVSNTPLS